MGEDHLLSVESNGYSEEYTRYYFKDVRAVFIRRTQDGKVWNGVLASALAVCLVALLASLGEGVGPGTVTLAILSSLPLALLTLNILRGPTCRSHILMPLGIHELTTLRRIRNARGVLDLIRPRISGIQGALSPEEVRAPAVNPAAAAPHLPVSGRGTPAARVEAAGPGYQGGLHYAAFSLLLGEAVFGLVSLGGHGGELPVVFVLLTLALFACLVAAVVKQHDSQVPRLAARLVWLAIGGIAISMITGYYAGTILGVMHARGNAGPPTDMTVIMGALMNQRYFPILVVVYSACCALVGLLGLISCLRWRSTSGRAPRGGAAAPGEGTAP